MPGLSGRVEQTQCSVPQFGARVVGRDHWMPAAAVGSLDEATVLRQAEFTEDQLKNPKLAAILNYGMTMYIL